MRALGVFGLAAMAVAGVPAHAATAGGSELVEQAAALNPGQYAWGAQPAAGGPVEIVVSIPLQQMFVYRGAALIAVSNVSTGSPGHETPVGEFQILQKEVTHHSNKYDDAPMPYMERLTWDGVAIHGGRDPGYPASHGCVRVPLAFARRLYAITQLGAHVSVTEDATAPGLPDDYPRPVVDPIAAREAAIAAASDPEVEATRAANAAAGTTAAATTTGTN